MSDNEISDPSEAGLEYGRRLARKVFARRRGHGGGRVRYIHVHEDALAAMLAIAYSTGEKRRSPRSGRSGSLVSRLLGDD